LIPLRAIDHSDAFPYYSLAEWPLAAMDSNNGHKSSFLLVMATLSKYNNLQNLNNVDFITEFLLILD